MPTVLRKAGFRFFFFSNEGKEPAHIHIESGDGYAKFWLEPSVILAESKNFDSRILNKLSKLTEENRQTLIEKWNEFFSKD